MTDPHPALKIDRIELFPVRYPTVMRFKFLEGPTSGAGRAAILVKITANDGTVGWGQSVPVPRWSYETLEGAMATLERYIIPVITGMNPFDLDSIHAAMNREVAGSFSTGAPITKAGIDIALHDLMGRHLGVNIAELWGRTLPDDLTLSWTLNPATVDDIDPLIDAGLERGYENFNIKVAPDLEFDLTLAKRLKERVPQGFLWADANGGYDLCQALQAAPRLADAGVEVLEQPLPPNRLTGYQELKRQGALPILLDEGVVAPSDLIEFIKLGCCDGVAMKPARCGGLLSAHRQISILEDAGLMFLGSGLTDPDISLAASLILFGAHGLRKPAALNGPQFLGASLITEPFVPKNGKLRLPKGPGLGIEVDEGKIRELQG
ncbi:MAG: enolase C-terminal domain-like protein [FCB group bacterium]|jgi:L-alanine-DL-glutamate epimerase-like enolase superfamily enzyme|nr:enolase C-terminal domain-like protein [FCB group bacterium]